MQLQFQVGCFYPNAEIKSFRESFWFKRRNKAAFIKLKSFSYRLISFQLRQIEEIKAIACFISEIWLSKKQLNFMKSNGLKQD